MISQRIKTLLFLGFLAAFGIGYFANYFGLPVDRLSDGKFSINQATTATALVTKTKSVPKESQTLLAFDNSSLDAPQTQTIADAELEMDDSLASLHLSEFTEYLHGEQASESTTLAYYTDVRWSEFYERVGYLPEDIHQLIAFRNQYLADTSQSGKEYYWSRWSEPPHRALADSLAYKIIPYLGNGENKESTLTNSISDIASEYGITVSLVERVAKTYLLDSIGRIESTSSIINSSFDSKVDVIKFDSDFVEYLKEQAGYTENTVVIDENRLKGI